jgi:hypothetical protein
MSERDEVPPKAGRPPEGPSTDLLDQGLRHLRDAAGDADESDVLATRRAVLAKASARRRRLSIARVVLPFAAVFGAGAAWAAATLPRIFHPSELVHSPSMSGSAPIPPGNTTPASSERSARVAAETSAPPPAVSDAKPAPTVPPPAREAVREPDDMLYRRAHEAHFVDHDWPRALAGWDAYLAKEPNGRFAPEARYNRALVLIRLGREDEARAALLPFANGTFGGYRQAEAQQLSTRSRDPSLAR